MNNPNNHIKAVKLYLAGCRRKWVYLTKWEKEFIKRLESENPDLIRAGSFEKLEKVFNEAHRRRACPQ